MCLTKDGLDIDSLWERKRQMVEEAKGLSVWRGGERFADIGGLENLKLHMSRLLNGRRKPRVIVFIDEIEKAMAGASGGDLSGVSEGMLGTLLTKMQDTNAMGVILIGPAGSGKSVIAKATGNEGGIPTVYFDLKGMEGSLVGESGAALRAALKVVDAVGQGDSLYLATCNKIAALPPELRRRFGEGTFFVDLPSAEEREAIWRIYLKKYQVKDGKRPDDEGWTGAEIFRCVYQAWNLNVPLAESAKFIVPISRSAADQIEQLRQQASNRYISASHSGVYRYDKTITAAPQRRIGLE